VGHAEAAQLHSLLINDLYFMANDRRWFVLVPLGATGEIGWWAILFLLGVLLLLLKALWALLTTPATWYVTGGLLALAGFFKLIDEPSSLEGESMMGRAEEDGA
jgi:hypothetical protein